MIFSLRKMSVKVATSFVHLTHLAQFTGLVIKDSFMKFQRSFLPLKSFVVTDISIWEYDTLGPGDSLFPDFTRKWKSFKMSSHELDILLS